MKAKNITIRAEAALIKAMAKVAAREGRSLNKQIIVVLKDWLSKHEEKRDEN